MGEILRHRPATAVLGAFVAAISLILTALAAPAESAFPGGNGKIAFETNRDGNFEIYTMNADGTGQTNRTNNNTGFDGSATWSADGQRIAFETNRDGNPEIYTMNADGTGQTNRTNNGASDNWPTLSGDGQKIAFQSFRDGNGEIYTMNTDGTGQTNHTNNAALDASPAWSPDGTKIVFYSTRDGNPEIYTMNADGTGQTRRTNISAGDGDPAWSPDGTKIVFESDRDGNSEIYTMNADGTGQTRRTINAAIDGDPAWSPDGTKIAFMSRRDGNFEIYTMNADRTGATRLTNNGPAVDDVHPDWQPLSYQHPKTTVPITVGLVPAMRQTISATQCAARGGTPGQHAVPLGFTSCDPPTPVLGTSAFFGGEGVASATITPVAGDTITAADEADYAFSVSLTDIRAGSLDGPDYSPDLRLGVELRMSDKNNCGPPPCGGPYYRPGTVVDFDFVAQVVCVGTADPAIGATCGANTTADALAPGAITESRQTVISANRVRVNDAGLDQISGNGDDKLFALQGAFIP